MQITLNGKKININSGLTVEELLKEQSFDVAKVVVERNQEIVTKNNYTNTQLAEGDSIEVLTFVGGG